MRRIRQEMAELSKKLSSLTRPSLKRVQGFLKKKIFISELFKTCFSGVIRGGEFEFEVGFSRKPIGRLGTNRNQGFLKHVFRG
jgi:hypothetical protein